MDIASAFLAVAGMIGLAAGPAAWAAPAMPAVEEAYLRYVSPTVTEPFPDLIRLAVPAELEDQRTAALGFVDVTKAPFLADPTGAKDATVALQAAINFARDHQMACFFPPGVYRVSGTLSCIQGLYRRSNGRVLGGHLFPCLLVGSRAGKERPRILLAPRSPGFGDPAKPKHLVHFWARGYLNATTAGRVGDGLSPDKEQPNISMNQMLVNLDLAIGEGNPGAVAIRHQAAEGSAIEECTIDATHGLMGIDGGIGSGGGSSGVTVIGGRIGLNYTGYLSGTQPTPTITGFTLIGQTETAIRSTSRQALVAAGLRIVAGPTTGPLIDCTNESWMPHNGQMVLVDSEIRFDPGTRAGTIIRTNRSVYLRNVYVRGAAEVVEGVLPGRPEGWLRVAELAWGQPPSKLKTSGVDLEYRYPVVVDGVRRERLPAEVEPGAEPPADLQPRHLPPADFPSWESEGAVNAKAAPYSAKGDGKADDAEALQRAVDAGGVVFLPKGVYRITRPIDLPPGASLVGVGQTMSYLVAAGDGAFGDADHPQPLLRTADDADATSVVAFLGLFAASDVPGVQALHWRSGARSVYRAVEIVEQPINGFTPRRREAPEPPPRHTPLVLITGHGGGKWYNFRAESAYRQAPGYRHLLIEGARGPLSFYQFSPQHVVGGEVAVEMSGARRVSIFGSKYEGNRPMLWVHDCDQIRHFGHGGNGKPLPESCLFRVEHTTNSLFANLVEGPTRIAPVTLGPQASDSTDPRLWHMLTEHPVDGEELRLEPMERPVLYKRGRPE